jgi:hypothetical protein
LTLATLPARGTKYNKPGKNNGEMIVKEWLRTRKRFRANSLDRLATKLTAWGLGLRDDERVPYGIRKQVLAALEAAQGKLCLKMCRSEGRVIYRPASAQERHDMRQKLGRQAMQRGRSVVKVSPSECGPSRKNGRGYCRNSRRKLAG